jgi:hypothetical protein
MNSEALRMKKGSRIPIEFRARMCQLCECCVHFVPRIPSHAFNFAPRTKYATRNAWRRMHALPCNSDEIVWS